MSRKQKHRFKKKDYRNILSQKQSNKKIVALRNAPQSSDSTKEVIAYQSEIDYIAQCILDYPAIETGGQLFGFYAAKGTPVVCYAIGPGLHANHQTTFFNQDVQYLQTIGDILTREYGLQHIGEWHSHHQLQLDHPSWHDAQTMHHAIDALQLGQFLLCIGTVHGQAAQINAFSFYEHDKAYYPAKWHVKATPSPYRQTIDERLKGLLIHPITSESRLTGMHISRIALAKDADVQYLLRAYNS